MPFDLSNPKHLALLKSAMLGAIQDMGDAGAPEGPMYSAFMSYGIDLHTFQDLAHQLVAEGKVRRSGYVLYYIVQQEQKEVANG